MGKVVKEAYYSQAPLEKTPHYHPCHQILLILQGEVKILVNGQRMTAGPGKLVLFSRYENHGVTVCEEPYVRYVLQLEQPAGQQEERLFSVLSHRPAGFGNVLDVSDDLEGFSELLAGIVDELAAQPSMTEEMQQLLVRQLLIRIYRRHPELAAHLENERYAAVFALQRRLEEQYDQQVKLEELAKDYAMSISSLSHRFKLVTGSSVMDYLLSCRIAAAKQYLTQTQIGIGQIVELCGFADVSNFGRTFKKLTGFSPSGFREHYGEWNGSAQKRTQKHRQNNRKNR